MTDFGHWLNKTAKEQQERYKREEKEEKAKALRVRLVEGSKLWVEEVSLSDTTEDDILETKNNNLEQYDILKNIFHRELNCAYAEIETELVAMYREAERELDLKFDDLFDSADRVIETQDDADLGYGEHYL